MLDFILFIYSAGSTFYFIKPGKTKSFTSKEDFNIYWSSYSILILFKMFPDILTLFLMGCIFTLNLPNDISLKFKNLNKTLKENNPLNHPFQIASVQKNKSTTTQHIIKYNDVGSQTENTGLQQTTIVEPISPSISPRIKHSVSEYSLSSRPIKIVDEYKAERYSIEQLITQTSNENSVDSLPTPDSSWNNYDLEF